jgi:protein-tyrosine kinase
MESIEKALKKAREQENALTGASSEVIDQTTRVIPVQTRVLRNNRIVAGIALEPEADLYRMLRAQVLKRLGESGSSTLGICSPGPEAGKTLTAINLAVSMSLDANQTVLLVDLDLRKPNVAERFGLKVSAGLSDYLFDQAQLSECLISPGIERLVLLPGGNAIHNSSEALTSPQMTKLAKELKERYPDRIVIYDLPPLLSSDDAMVFLPKIDATLLVVREGSTRASDIRRSIGLLQDSNLIGTVLNGSAEENFFPYF